MHARAPDAAMMFCTTFLSAPSEELHCEASRSRGGALGGEGVGPGSCLSSLRCVVLPQDDPNTSARVCVCTAGRAHKWAGALRLGDRGGGCFWDGARRRRRGSASLSPSKTPKNAPREGAKGMSERRPWRSCHGNSLVLELKSLRGSDDVNRHSFF